MHIIMEILAGITGVYMLLIFIRIMLTWFSGASYGRPMELLCGITDPYLNWFRRFSLLRTGLFDLSPLVAMAVLSIGYNVFSIIARSGGITIGVILAMAVASVWSAVSFILVFFIIALALRLIAYLLNVNSYGRFWQVVDAASKPVLYRINRLLFQRRLVHYRTGILASIGFLLVTMIIGGSLVKVVISVFHKLPF
ncbi:MAG: YggT family protein [Spirochaetaceae bacterium]|nr:YggT family protein [Spirochaetaceae bacterium]